jgi:hypothetical protein
MKLFRLVALLVITSYASGQATIAITCTSCTSGSTTVTANSFQATGVSAGGLTLPSGSPPSTATIGLTPNAITLFAPSSVTAYGVSPYSGTSLGSGFWYGTLGSGATFGTVTVTGGVIASISGTGGVTNSGSGYFTAPPCYFTTTGSYTTPATCYFSVLNGGITAVNFTGTGGTGYTGTVSVNAGPVLDLSYLPASDATNLLTNAGVINTGYAIQISNGTLTNGHLASFNGSGDAVDSGVPVGGSGVATSGNYLRGNGTYFTSSAIQASDVPTLNQNTTGTAASLSGSITAGTILGNFTTSSGAPSAGNLHVPDTAQTGNYQVLASDFAACKTIPISSGTVTVTLVASTSQPAAGQCIWIVNYSGNALTIARSSQNINGQTSNLTTAAGTATVPTAAWCVSDGTNYECATFSMNASQLGGKTFAAPAAIGNTTAAAGSFTTLTATQLNQTASNSFAGSCTMSSGTTCTFTATATFTNYLAFASIDHASTPTANVAKCSISGTTVTITAALSNSLTWDCLLIGNPS